MKKHKIQKVDILKIDIEGAEFAVLANFSLWAAVERIVVEWHSEIIRTEIIKLLDDQGFRMVREDSTTGDYYGEGYFCRH